MYELNQASINIATSMAQVGEKHFGNNTSIIPNCKQE